MHIAEIVRLPMVSHIILNVCAKSAVKSMAKGIVTIANLGGVLIELNHILHDSVSVPHPEMFEGILGISDGIEGTKIGSKFLKEGSIGVLPCRQIPMDLDRGCLVQTSRGRCRRGKKWHS